MRERHSLEKRFMRGGVNSKKSSLLGSRGRGGKSVTLKCWEKGKSHLFPSRKLQRKMVRKDSEGSLRTGGWEHCASVHSERKGKHNIRRLKGMGCGE